MKFAKIEKLDPRVWGVNVRFKVLKSNELKEVNFKDGSVHKVQDFLVADDSASIIFNVWDESIELIKVDENYILTEARLTVFNNTMKLAMSRKSEILPYKEDIIINSDINMSEKRFQPVKKNYRTFYKK